jgi:hypothetical protein
MRRLDLLATAAVSALLGACATANITVTASGHALDLAPRKADCVVEFHRTRAPERPFDEIATLHLQGANLDAWEAQEEMRRRACALGADAIVVTRDYMGIGSSVVMIGTAVSYAELRANPAARLARDARGISELMPPPGFALAVARSTTPLRMAWNADATVQGEIAAGTGIWAEKNDGDMCRVRHPDGRGGWVDCGALAFGEKPAADEKPRTSAPSPTSI